MKKRNVFTSCLVLLMLLATVAVYSSVFVSCASTRTQESTGGYVDDSVITTKVKGLLAQDDFLKSFQISVETFKGTVQLSGFVNSQKAVDKAGEIARSVKGVDVCKEQSDREIGPVPEFPAQMEESIDAYLQGSPVVPASDPNRPESETKLQQGEVKDGKKGALHVQSGAAAKSSFNQASSQRWIDESGRWIFLWVSTRLGSRA